MTLMTTTRLARRAAMALIVSLAFSAAPPVRAQQATNSTEPPTPVRQSIGVSISNGMLSLPLVEGQLQTKLAPGYATVNNGNDVNMDGWAVTGSATYGFTKHWGVGLLAGYTDLTGKNRIGIASALQGVPAALDAKVVQANGHDSTRSKGHGTVVMANLIWDHWTGEGFRMPLYMGLGYMDLTETRDNPVIGVKNEGTLAGAAVALGMVPSFSFSKFRAAAFLMFSSALDDGTQSLTNYDPATGAQISKHTANGLGGSDNLVTVIGSQLTYVPWGVTASYVPPIDSASTYGLSWTRRWGGSASKTP